MSVLITGVTGGLGSVLARELITANYSIVGLYRNPDIFGQFVLPNQDAQKFIKLDLEHVLSKTDCVDVPANEIEHVVFCHGLHLSNSLCDVTLNDLSLCMQVNFYATSFICQYLIDDWIKDPKKNRSITYISSVAAKTGAETELAYHASKRAGEALMLSIARAYTQNDIRANVISPGLMNTPMGEKTVANRPDVLSRLPMGRIVDALEVARLCTSLLVSPSITGQNFHINAGRYFSI